MVRAPRTAEDGTPVDDGTPVAGAETAGPSRVDAAPGGAARLVRRRSWAGLAEGDPVDVGGEARRGASYAFVAHVRNTRTGEEWVEVVGGRGGRRTLRSFVPERIYPAGGLAGRRRVPPLASAPRLPLGRHSP